MMGLEETVGVSYTLVQRLKSAVSNRSNSMDDEMRGGWERVVATVDAGWVEGTNDIVGLVPELAGYEDEKDDGESEESDEENDEPPAGSQRSLRGRPIVKTEKAAGKEKAEVASKKKVDRSGQKTFAAGKHCLRSLKVSLPASGG
jgi:hypothetical protein